MFAIREDREINSTIAQELQNENPRMEQWVKQQIELSEGKLKVNVGKQLTLLEEQIGEHLLETGRYVDRAVADAERRILQRAFMVIDNARQEFQTSMKTNVTTTWTWAALVCCGVMLTLLVVVTLIFRQVIMGLKHHG